MKELDLAMNNGYHILMGDITIDDLLSNSSRQKLYISFDPDKLNSNDYWDNIINSMSNSLYISFCCFRICSTFIKFR